MRLRSFTLVASLMALSACSTPITDSPQLANSQWTLTQVDGQPLPADTRASLAFDDRLQISGNAGCNRFFGPSELNGQHLKADHLGATKMACLDEATQQLEAAVLATFNQQPSITRNADQLTLKSKEHTLEYQLTNDK